MLRALARLPLPVSLMAVAAAMMLIPSAHALSVGDYFVARVFFYSALLSGCLALFVVLAMLGQKTSDNPRRHLVALAGAFVLLPVMLAFPLHQAVGNTSFLNAWVEMVSSLTTTGATLFDDPGRLAPSVHLWRALVGWLGGLVMWIAAVAILAPLAIGGFEVRADPVTLAANAFPGAAGLGQAATTERIRRATATLAPIYAGLTGVLWLGLILSGARPFVAFNHALSTMATSGISPVGGLGAPGTGGIMAEAIMALFFVFAISRMAFFSESRAALRETFTHDPEMRLGLALIGAVSAFLFLRHWLGAYEVADQSNLGAAARALWGTVFTVMSFLTTTGFESAWWGSGQAWSGLETSGLILMGLALVGGGVATTAGGVKLLRVHALYRQSTRELERLVLPHSVAGKGARARHLRTKGAFRAWIFFMLLLASVAGVVFVLAALGESFDHALVLAISAITTTGPLTRVALDAPIDLAGLSDLAKLIFGGAMVLGRLELLAVVVLFNPDLWRR